MIVWIRVLKFLVSLVIVAIATGILSFLSVTIARIIFWLFAIFLALRYLAGVGLEKRTTSQT